MLQGVRVVELATMVAAPSAVGLLADWGAQVVKIEPHAGDPMPARPGSPLGILRELGFGDPDLARMQGDKTIPSGAQGPP